MYRIYGDDLGVIVNTMTNQMASRCAETAQLGPVILLQEEPLRLWQNLLTTDSPKPEAIKKSHKTKQAFTNKS